MVFADQDERTAAKSPSRRFRRVVFDKHVDLVKVKRSREGGSGDVIQL